MAVTSRLCRIDGAQWQPRESTLVSALRNVVNESPTRLALEFRGEGWTYRDLWRRATGVAGALVECGVGEEELIGLWAERKPATVAAALGVMMAGAAYVPLDPEFPLGRVASILASAQPRILLKDGASPLSSVDWARSTVLNIDDMYNSIAPEHLPDPRSDGLAYVIYTSGSTGSPKGVMIEHGSLLNYCAWCAALAGDTPHYGSPLLGSLGFDHSISSYWPTLLSGGCVVICEGPWDMQNILEHPRSPYSLLKLTPSHLQLYEKIRRPDFRPITKLLLCGGEALEAPLVQGYGSRLSGVRLVNHYGPTETTVGSCYYEFSVNVMPGTPLVPIGRPIWNTRAYLVNGDLAPVTRGQSAELVIAGAGVARGYIGSEGTSDRFVDEVELGGMSGRAYRTGDMVELLEDGNILFLGRNDEQVKINGYRLELAELRAHALSVPGVADAAFCVTGGLVKEVEGLLVPMDGVAPSAVIQAVARALQSFLPSQAVPRSLVAVSDILLNANGKRDLIETKRRLTISSEM